MSVIEIDTPTLDDIACMHDEVVRIGCMTVAEPSNRFLSHRFERTYGFALRHAEHMYKREEGTHEGQQWREFFEHLACYKEAYNSGTAPIPSMLVSEEPNDTITGYIIGNL